MVITTFFMKLQCLRVGKKHNRQNPLNTYSKWYSRIYGSIHYYILLYSSINMQVY